MATKAREANVPPARPRNRLLAALPKDAYQRLLPRLSWEPMQNRQQMFRSDEVVADIYFPESGVISVLMFDEEGAAVEVATVGREGFVGTPVLLGTDRSPANAFCQVPGYTWRLSATHFREELGREPALLAVLLRYTQALLNQVAQSSACNRLHTVEERAARWLLMTRDRVDEDRFPLTQEFLGQMLGVRRQAVNLAAGVLQRAGLISYTRGVIAILDRPGLEAAACSCYRLIRREMDRLAGRPD